MDVRRAERRADVPQIQHLAEAEADDEAGGGGGGNPACGVRVAR